MDDALGKLSLNAIGIMEGADKASLVADYLTHYETALHRYRAMPINLLEIGVFEGASLRVWRRFFSQATLVGVDINPNCKQFEGDRTVVRIGSQADPGFLARVATEFPPTIIIDDGSHRADHILFTFDRLFPILAPGGCYIVEDLYLHEGRERETPSGRTEQIAR